MDELKKCPFCGNTAELTFSGKSYNGYAKGFVIVKCTRCGGAGKGYFYEGEPIEEWGYPLEESVGGQWAIKAWNTRVD